MCVPKTCSNYQPDSELAKRQGYLCFVLGYEPLCKNCGQEAFYHQVAWSEDD